MDEAEYDRQLKKIRENVKKIKENDTGSFLEADESGDVDETTQKLLGLNILNRETKSLLESVKNGKITSNQSHEIEALERELNDAALNNAQVKANPQDQSDYANKEESSGETSRLKTELQENGEAQIESSRYESCQPTNISDLTRLTRHVSTNIQKIKVTIADIARMVEHIGTSNDSSQLKARLADRFQYAQNLVKDTMTILTDINITLPEQSSLEKRHHQKRVKKLAEEYETVTKEFQNIQRKSATKQRKILQITTVSEERTTLGPENLQQQALLPKELDDIQERNDAIRRLESDIADVNQIFIQLHTMVEGQGETIDEIEAHVEEAVEDIHRGKKNLDSAEKSQVSRRKKMIVCGVVGIIFLITLIVIIVISFS